MAALEHILSSGQTGIKVRLTTSEVVTCHEVELIQLQVYNLGTGRGYTVLEVIRGFEEVMGPGKTIPWEIVGRREGDVAECYADTEKARRELGFRSEKTLADMCSSEMKWRAKQRTK